tara:strand:+ start:2607 stop:2888 length:282 start_codon:yes stop_codon:yes gene_type:complete
MRYFNLLILLNIIFLNINQVQASDNFLEKDTNSIIKIFCLESVKASFLESNLEFKVNFGEEICDCYINKISNNISHEESISQCKIKNREKFEI